MAILSRITIYPIKALPGVDLPSVHITAGGTLANDRRWAMVDKQGRMQNGKNCKRVFGLTPTIDLNERTIRFKDEAERFELSCNDLLHEYLSDTLGKTITLIENDKEGFPDDPEAYGPTIVSMSSLAAVQEWFPTLSLYELRARFRMNMELADTPAFWEDQVFRHNETPTSVCVGEVLINATNPCARCSVPTKSPETGQTYDGFFDTFVANRERHKPAWVDARCFDHWYRFGLNTRISVDQQGAAISVGDTVKLL